MLTIIFLTAIYFLYRKKYISKKIATILAVIIAVMFLFGTYVTDWINKTNA